MICGHCKRPNATVKHVKSCSVYHNTAKRAIQRQKTPVPNVTERQEVLRDGVFIAHTDRGSLRTDYYVVVESQEGRLYAKKFNEDTRRWEYAKGAIQMLRDVQQLGSWSEVDLDQAKEFGRAFGVCMICGRRLTNPDSIEAGIGPVCAGRM